MGSWGSGRWGYHRKATTVEECRVLDLGDLAGKGAFVPGYKGSVRWLRGAEVVASIGYTVRPGGDRLILQLSYRCTRAGEDVVLPIRLETTPLHFAPGGRYYGCRHCYRLTYRSVQEHDKRVDALRRNPAALRAILADPAAHLQGGRVLLAIKALGHPFKGYDHRFGQ